MQISQSPFRVPTSFAVGEDAQAERARAMLDALGDSGAAWDARVERTRTVKTTLNRLGVRDAADLVHHGYVLAMANLHVLLDYPLLPLPSAARFAELVGGNPEQVS